MFLLVNCTIECLRTSVDLVLKFVSIVP
jgi:hypothetical protein